MIRLAALVWMAAAGAAAALDLTLPAAARLSAERLSPLEVYAAPVGVFQDGAVARLRAEGAVRRAAWRIATPGLTPLQVMAPLRTQVAAAGYEVLLDCDAAACGGFDFRFAIEVLPGPGMVVNLRSYHALTAARPDAVDPAEVVSLLVSTDAAAAHVQIVQVETGAAQPPAAAEAAPVAQARQPVAPVAPGSLAARLRRDGRVVLAELEFASGTSQLGEGPFAALEALAAAMAADAALRVALVGHTDFEGSLAGNQALSLARARAVRDRLTGPYGVAPARVEAQGVGYLAPLTSNASSAGREANRRVEVVVLE